MILIACEESQAVCKAFRARGHKAFSCDIMPCSGGHPDTWTAGHNAIGEVLEVRQDKISLEFNKKEFEDCYLCDIIDNLIKGE